MKTRRKWRRSSREILLISLDLGNGTSTRRIYKLCAKNSRLTNSVFNKKLQNPPSGKWNNFNKSSRKSSSTKLTSDSLMRHIPQTVTSPTTLCLYPAPQWTKPNKWDSECNSKTKHLLNKRAIKKLKKIFKICQNPKNLHAPKKKKRLFSTLLRKNLMSKTLT